MSEDTFKEILRFANKRDTTFKKAQTIKLDQRLWLYLDELGVSATKVIDMLLRQFITANGLDVTRAHPDEQCGWVKEANGIENTGEPEFYRTAPPEWVVQRTGKPLWERRERGQGATT